MISLLSLLVRNHSEMGCGGSREEHPRQRQPRPALQIGQPQNVTIHVPRNRADAPGVPIQRTNVDISRDVLVQALSIMAGYLNQERERVTIIAVGGAVNTLLLRSRAATHDVDIFGTTLDNRTRILLDEAMLHVARNTQHHLGTDWLNTETQMWMSPMLHQDLTQEALEQNVILFQQPGLTVLAAPWKYAFSAKVRRLLTGGSNARPYDMEDAVAYLNQIVTSNNGQPISLDVVTQWATLYNHQTTADFLLNHVDVNCRRAFGRSAIARQRASRRRQ